MGRRSIIPIVPGAYQGTPATLAHVRSRELGDAILRDVYERPTIGGFRCLARNDPTSKPIPSFLTLQQQVVETWPTPNGEQFVWTTILPSSNPELASGLFYRFLLNTEFVTDWLRAASARFTTAATTAPGGPAAGSNWSGMELGSMTLSFDQVQTYWNSLTDTVQVQGVWAFGHARFAAVQAMGINA